MPRHVLGVLMKLSRQIIFVSMAVVLLSGCSSSPEQRRQAKDNFSYLQNPEFKVWHLPETMQPQFYPNYDIPEGNYQGEVGQKVDVRAPQLLLELIAGARFEQTEQQSSLWFVQPEEAQKTWDLIQDFMVKKNIKLRRSNEQQIETEWVSWQFANEDAPINSRYLIEQNQVNNRYGIHISLLEWDNKNPSNTRNQWYQQRYTALMTNLIALYSDEQGRELAKQQASLLLNQIPIAMGNDRSGLPVIIARASYDVLWVKLPDVLTELNFRISERNQSQGTIQAKYVMPNDDFWLELGVEKPTFESNTYSLLLGDLGNRTSINFTDSAGKLVDEERLSELVPVFSAVIERLASKDK